MTAWLDIAWAAEGVEETGGRAATPEILAYFRDAGHPEIVSDEVAWCAAFAGACLARAGLPHTGSLMARSYLKYGTPIDTPRVGAIAVLRRGADPSAGHVGFVVGSDATHLRLLGGNQNDAVSVARFPRAMLVGLRWPPVEAAPKELAKSSRIVKASGGQQADAGKAGVVSGAELVIPAPPPSLGLGDLATQAGAMQSAAETIEKFLLFAWGKGGLIAGAFAAYWIGRMAWNAGWIGKWRAEDQSTGKTGP